MAWLDRLLGRTPRPDPMTEALAASQRGDYAAALAIWEPLARGGHPRACNNIGACFAEGLGVDPDPALALRWLTLAADGHDPVGQRNCAAMWFRGEGVPEPDFARAADLCRKAAEQGDGPAQDMLSWMLLEGEVMSPDPAEAHRWALAAAERGVAASMTRLGMLYHNALGVDRDSAQAAHWWRKGATAGDADGQAMLGAAYLMGMGIAKDPLVALAWLLRAQNNGSALAGPFLPQARAALDRSAQVAAERLALQPLGEIAEPAP